MNVNYNGAVQFTNMAGLFYMWHGHICLSFLMELYNLLMKTARDVKCY